MEFQPDFVLNRIHEIIKENGISDTAKVGLYGLTYRENADDMRESPILQLLNSQKHHLTDGMKIYDPFIETDEVPNQFHDPDPFLSAADFVVIMVRHNEILKNMEKLIGKIVPDCHNICRLPGIYHL